jgi:hypothetical protein
MQNGLVDGEPKACGCLYLEVGEIQPSERHAASARYQLGKLSDIVFPKKSALLLSRTISKCVNYELHAVYLFFRWLTQFGHRDLIADRIVGDLVHEVAD